MARLPTRAWASSSWTCSRSPAASVTRSTTVLPLGGAISPKLQCVAEQAQVQARDPFSAFGHSKQLAECHFLVGLDRALAVHRRAPPVDDADAVRLARPPRAREQARGEMWMKLSFRHCPRATRSAQNALTFGRLVVRRIFPALEVREGRVARKCCSAEHVDRLFSVGGGGVGLPRACGSRLRCEAHVGRGQAARLLRRARS